MEYYVVALEFRSSKRYIADLIRAYAKKHDISVDAIQRDQKILLIFDDKNNIDSFTKLLDAVIPVSIFLGKTTSYILDEKPKIEEIDEPKIPQNLAPCPACQEAMFDIKSRHYYYPFTSCNNCGPQAPFLEKYSFVRKNTSFRFLSPCDACKSEFEKNPLRVGYPLISCSQCGVALRMVDKKSERIANDSATYRKLFEVAAKILNKGESLLMKTPFGYRLFSKVQKDQTYDTHTKVMFCNANSISHHTLLIKDEFTALLSIERPLMRVATQSEELKVAFGSSILAKYPDEGMSMLLANELYHLGIDYIGYKNANSETDADYLITFDLPIIAPQESMLSINQDKRTISSGERISFPSLVKDVTSKAVVAHAMVSFPFEDTIIIDSMQRACDIEVEQLYVLEGDDFAKEHPNAKIFKQSHASIMSVLAENTLLGKDAVGVYFEENIEFLFCRANKPMTIIPSIDINCDNFWQDIATLRAGSDRLVENFKEKFPEIYSTLDNSQLNANTFEIAAAIIDVGQINLEGIAIEALKFLGKAGLAIDTHIKDNRFESKAFLASIISYKLAGVEQELLCYSVFESIGDYIADGALQLCEKSGSDTVALSGKNIANQILYGRLKKKLGSKNIVTNIEYPLSKENALYGALYL
ncbi:MAG: hypothetical protein JXQ68_07040 [Campylobacterales bacterium]|nr:hypothetical protein [Campylobacterales bacterium]